MVDKSNRGKYNVNKGNRKRGNRQTYQKGAQHKWQSQEINDNMTEAAGRELYKEFKNK